MANGFIDKARITVRAGNGGNGAVAFHREKYVAAGGPDGGDGGDGGSIIVQVDDNMSTLMDFRYKRKYVAAPGVDGQGGRKSGKDGQSLTIRVPRGTLIRDAETGEIEVESNNAGGILGGISTGAPVMWRMAVKPTPSIGREQQTVDMDAMENAELSVHGRHDPCIVPRAVPVAEAAAALAIWDALLEDAGQL